MTGNRRKLRIGLAGFSCECCTDSPLQTRETDFQQFHGKQLLEQYPFLNKYPECEFIPLRRARALPGGSIDPSFYDQFKNSLCHDLRTNGPWDGLFLHLHGAAHVTGRQDLEGNLICALREITGPQCLISASYDLHGNVSHIVTENLDILTAYRTAPHIDWFETVERAVDLLVTCLKNRWKPVMKFIPVPVYLSGEQSSTEYEPAKSLYASIPELINRHNLLDASILIGYVWANEPRTTASVITIALDKLPAEFAAKELADSFWKQRNEFGFSVRHGSVDQCIQWAMTSTDHPVVISDSGDNPTAGGVGDNPFVLERLLALQCNDALVAGIADAPVVDACFAAGTGHSLIMSIGATLDNIHGSPIEIHARVKSLHTQISRISATSDTENRVAVITVSTQLQGPSVDVIVTQKRTPFHHQDDFKKLHVDPNSYQIVVVKMGYLVPEIAQLAAESLLAISPGSVKQLDFQEAISKDEA